MLRRALLTATVVLVAACSGGRDALLADLQSTRPEVRALAVRKLAERGDADDVSLFTQAARDPAAIVRGEAMTALGRTEDVRVVDLLGEALADADEQVQQRAAAALAAFKTDKARSYLTLQYSRRGRSTRLAIVAALKGTHIPGAMASVVAAEAKAAWDRNLKALTEGTLPERVGAAEELGRSGRPEAVNRLVPLLKDKHVALAAAAARALGLAGDARAAPALAGLLDENFPELREAACEALGDLQEPTVLPRLLLVAQEKSPVSLAATRAIAQLPRSPESDAALCQIVLDGDEAALGVAGRELRRRQGCPAERLLERLKGPATVRQGLRAVGALGTRAPELVPPVTAALSSPDAETRRLAIEALAALGGPAAEAALTRQWEHELKALEPRRADWVAQPLPKSYAAAFDPAREPPAEDPWASVRARTSDLLGRVRTLNAQRAKELGKTVVEVPPPTEIVDDTEEGETRPLAAALVGLARVGAPGTAERARLWGQEPQATLRGASFTALALLGEDARAGLFDVDRGVQAATAQALVEAGPAGQRALLLALPGISGDRSRLLEPLRGVVPPQDALDSLLRLVREGGTEAGVGALLLAEMRAGGAVPALVRLLDDPSAVARREALVALGRLGDPAAAEAVARDLYSDSAEVRATAATALAALKATAHLEAIDALTGDYDRRVRASAAAALAVLSAPSRPTEGAP